MNSWVNSWVQKKKSNVICIGILYKNFNRNMSAHDVTVIDVREKCIFSYLEHNSTDVLLRTNLG